jgi:hypothetical protein
MKRAGFALLLTALRGYDLTSQRNNPWYEPLRYPDLYLRSSSIRAHVSNMIQDAGR